MSHLFATLAFTCNVAPIIGVEIVAPSIASASTSVPQLLLSVDGSPRYDGLSSTATLRSKETTRHPLVIQLSVDCVALFSDASGL
ncbi:hypothetical protein C1H46_017165 [Malus baccata]|uniref:Secreted protein n=1 Tax=Malus baccata TaxID=106549 RepID=A0A540MET6_MALBA|nr:hypothetical protein C1H46_017165 [Malus baccata]